MYQSTEFKYLERLRTPLFITNKSGTVIYKNSALSLHIKKPHLGASIYKYITSGTDENKIFPDGFPAYAVIEYKEDSGLDAKQYARRAFVFEKRSSREETLIWLFPRRIYYLSNEQARSLLPFYTQRLGTLRALIDLLYNSPPGKTERSLPLSRSPESAYDSITSASSQRRGIDNYEIPIDLSFFIKTFGDCAARQLGLRGFRFELNCEDLRVGDVLTVAGLELAALCAQLVYASLIIGGGHTLIWNCKCDAKTLILEFIAPYLPDRNAPVCFGSLYEAASQNPEIAPELFFCDLLWSSPGRRVSWNSTSKNSVLRADYTLDNSKFVILRQNDGLNKKELKDKINDIIQIIN